MTLQESLDRIVELLDKLRTSDAKAQKAWEAAVERCNRPHDNHLDVRLVLGPRWSKPPCRRCGGIVNGGAEIVARDLSTWPNGAVRGLLEFDIAGALGEPVGATIEEDGTSVSILLQSEAIAAALIKAMEAR